MQGGDALFGDFVVKPADPCGRAAAPCGAFLGARQCTLGFGEAAARVVEETGVVDDLAVGQGGQVVDADVDADSAGCSLASRRDDCGRGGFGEDAGVPAVAAAADGDGLDYRAPVDVTFPRDRGGISYKE